MQWICLFETFSRLVGHATNENHWSTTIRVIFGMMPALVFKHSNLRSNLLHEVGVFILLAYLPVVVSKSFGMAGVGSTIFAGVSMKRYASRNWTPEAP
ncbi:hypothetical protein PsorP6_007225 [Peronosclerospora sorghi]|uniref:Uncharacterized protein n=1 Tax=Peronosclerospora sorghi TaxID=230839 RepID=A0ACC0WCE9_9STRA|nr:hypothetical protein PsorP6_007225 [Peronosclerospora sorghi]